MTDGAASALATTQPPSGAESTGLSADAQSSSNQQSDAQARAGCASSATAERESASRTFFTTIDAEKEKGKGKEGRKNRYLALESANAGPRVTEHHQDLITLANSLDQRMAALLREHEKDFFLAYKTHMYTVQKEIKTLKLKADHEEAKTREDTKIKNLEGELDWFMTEALRLDELCKGYKKEVDKWKAKAEALDEDRRFLEDQIKGAKRQNKILRAAAERARSSAYCAIVAAGSKAETARMASLGTASGDGRELAQPSPALANRTTRPQSSGPRPAAGSGARRAHEARSATPDAQAHAQTLDGNGVPRSVSAASLSPAGFDPFEGFNPTSVLGNAAEQRYADAIGHLKSSIAREKQSVRMLQAVRATSYSRKSEMEELFLRCVDEARREMVRKQHVSQHKAKSDSELVLESMLSSEDVLVSLYEKLFPHRTGIAKGLGAPLGATADDTAGALFAQFAQ